MNRQEATVPVPPPRPSGGHVVPVGPGQAEAVLVEHYPRLVRLAYLILPPGPDRGRRVLAAHAVAQRALPRKEGPSGPAGGSGADDVPGQRGAGAIGPLTPGAAGEAPDPAGDGGYAFVRLRVLRAALRAGRPRRPWHTGGRPPLLPLVLGLRLFPRSGGADQLALDEALAELPAPARAAYALRGLERLSARETRRVLAAAGVADPDAALDRAEGVAVPVGSRDEQLLESPEFDPCSLQARPTDLLLRRRHLRAALAAAAAAAVCGTLLALPGDGWAPDTGRGPERTAAAPPAENPALRQALDPASLLRAGADSWKSADRPGFAHWPARGDRTDDEALLGRALSAWASPDRDVPVSATPGTATGPPAGPAGLLYSGAVDNSLVVLLYDGLRVVRYAEPRTKASGKGRHAVLDFARADSATAASASALVLDRPDGNVRYLTAPWVSGAHKRDLMRPGSADRPLRRSADGVTAPSASPATAEDCRAWQATVLHTMPSLPGPSSLLLTDLGELTPAALTYGEPPGSNTGSSPDDPAARANWARTACELGGLRATGVRAVNSWRFAQQPLPDGSGSADWVCTRAETWRGEDSRVAAQFLPPADRAAEPAAVTARATGDPACGAREPRVLAGVLWHSEPADQWYMLAAGSAEVASISTTGSAETGVAGRLLALPVAEDTRVNLTARLPDGTELPPLG